MRPVLVVSHQLYWEVRAQSQGVVSRAVLWPWRTGRETRHRHRSRHINSRRRASQPQSDLACDVTPVCDVTVTGTCVSRPTRPSASTGAPVYPAGAAVTHAARRRRGCSVTEPGGRQQRRVSSQRQSRRKKRRCGRRQRCQTAAQSPHFGHATKRTDS